MFKKCEKCFKEEYPLHAWGSLDVCKDCRIKLEIFETLQKMGGKFKNLLERFPNKKFRCHICGKVPLSKKNHYKCICCENYACFSHSREIRGEIHESTSWASNIFPRLLIEGRECEKCLKDPKSQKWIYSIYLRGLLRDNPDIFGKPVLEKLNISLLENKEGN